MLARVAASSASHARLARRARPALVVGLALVLLPIVLRAFVADVYRVDGASMEPTLLGPSATSAGERVLVLFEREPRPQRFDLVVVRRAGSAAPVVKRVVALPGERVQIQGRDLLIDGARLPESAPRPAWIALYDQALLDPREHFYFEAAPQGPWTVAQGELALDARAIAPASDGGLLLYHKELGDGWIGRDGRVVPAGTQLSDGALECELLVETGAGRVRLRLVEQADVFEVVLELRADGCALARLERRSSGDALGRSDLDQAEIEFAPERWHALRFWNRDNALGFELDGERVLTARYAANEPIRGLDSLLLPVAPDRSLGARAAIGGEGLRARVRGLRILRDLDYVERGSYAVESAYQLGPDECFVLGDSSAKSSDSREFGPVKLADLIGRPRAVVWPLRALRWLEGAHAPPEPAPH
jgi:signal peptidase I